jgi:hypothetical protein
MLVREKRVRTFTKSFVIWGRPVVFKAAISTDWSLWTITEQDRQHHQLIGLSYVTPIEESGTHGLQFCCLWLLACIGWQ